MTPLNSNKNGVRLENAHKGHRKTSGLSQGKRQ
jgi:hypothetical protein